MNIVFAGTPDFAREHLKALLDAQSQGADIELVAVYTQPDRPAGRGKKLRASPVKTLAQAHALTLHQPETLRSEEAVNTLAALKPDLMVVVAYGLLLPQAILETPRLGCINVHASLLPRWRGAAPIQRAIEAGDRESGVTIMQMDVGLDTGAMLSKAYCAIEANDSAAELHDKLASIGPRQLLDTLAKLDDQQANAEVQDDSLSTYAAKIDKAEACIDWHQSAEHIHRKIRAFNPFPVCYSFLNGERIKIYAAQLLAEEQAYQHHTRTAPGSLSIAKGKLLVQCGEGTLEIRALQTPGKKCVDAKAYLNGINQQLPADCFTSS